MGQAKLEFLLALENSQFNKALVTSQQKVVLAGKKMSHGFDPAISKFKKLSSTLALVGAAAGAAAAIGGLYKLQSLVKESVQLAGEQEAAEAKLQAVLTATGGAAGFTAEELGKYASRLQSITTYGDETTISAMAVLASFKNIKGDAFKDATKAAMDMSTLMGTDLQSNIVLVGKALNNPIKGLSALGRVGVEFTQSQKDMIVSLQESGDLLGAQKIILAELNGEFGGSSEAIRKTFVGALEASQGALSDFKEEIGFAITKNQALVAGLNFIEKQLQSWAGQMKANGADIREFTKSTALALVDMGIVGLDTVDFLYRGFNLVSSAFKTVAAGANLLVGAFLKIVQVTAIATDYLGITTDAAKLWAFHAAVTFKAASDLAIGAAKDAEEMANGATKIQAASDALRGLKRAMENVPVDGLAPVAVSAETSKQKIVAVKDATHSLSQEIGAVSADKLSDVGGKAEAVKKKMVDATTASKAYTEELVKINGIWTQQQKSAEDVKPKVDNIKKSLGGLKNEADGFSTKWERTMDAFLKDGSGKVEDLEKKLQALTKDRRIKVYVKEVIQKAAGGLVAQRMATGGTVKWHDAIRGLSLPGFGGGDRRHVLAEDGEVMVNKYAVKAAGLKAALAFNAGNWPVVISELQKRFTQGLEFGGLVGSFSLPLLPPLPLQAGGMVNGSAAPAEETVTVRFDFSNTNGQQPSGRFSKRDAGELLDAFKRLQDSSS